MPKAGEIIARRRGCAADLRPPIVGAADAVQRLGVIVGLIVVCCALAAGELVARTTGLPIPGSVIGLVALVVALRLRVVQADRLRPATDLLVRRMGLFFVPAGVIAVTRHGRALAGSLGTIAIASLLSFVVVLLVVGRLAARGARG